MRIEAELSGYHFGTSLVGFPVTLQGARIGTVVEDDHGYVTIEINEKVADNIFGNIHKEYSIGN